MEFKSTQNESRSRKYTSLVCVQCREKHRRCDGQQPCLRCKNWNLVCTFTKTKPRGGNHRTPKITEKIVLEPQPIMSLSVPTSLPPLDITMYTNYYAKAFTRSGLTAPLSINFPSDLSALDPTQKFRVNATLALTALTLGHLTRLFLPQALSSCTLDAAIGFAGLASCHMMEFELTPTTTYLKLSKGVALNLWRMQKPDYKNNFITTSNVGPVIVHSIMKSLQLTMTSFNSEGNLAEAVKATQKKLDKLADVAQKIQIPYTDIQNLASGLFSLYMAEASEVFQAIENVEKAAKNLAYKWKEHSNMFIHVVRSLKFALLRDDLAMRNECGLLLQLFDGLTAHNCTSLSSMYTTALLWSALGLENELQTLVLIAQRVSISFPGGKFIAERFGKQLEPGSVSQWNPFVELVSKFNAMQTIDQSSQDMVSTINVDPALSLDDLNLTNEIKQLSNNDWLY